MKLQQLYSYVRQAIDDYQMIADGDQIAVLTIQGDPQRPIHHNAGPLLALADLEEDGILTKQFGFSPKAGQYILIFLFRDAVKQAALTHHRSNWVHEIPPCCRGNRQLCCKLLWLVNANRIIALCLANVNERGMGG